jgi:hypothetical protein
MPYNLVVPSPPAHHNLLLGTTVSEIVQDMPLDLSMDAVDLSRGQQVKHNKGTPLNNNLHHHSNQMFQKNSLLNHHHHHLARALWVFGKCFFFWFLFSANICVCVDQFWIGAK